MRSALHMFQKLKLQRPTRGDLHICIPTTPTSSIEGQSVVKLLSQKARRRPPQSRTHTSSLENDSSTEGAHRDHAHTHVHTHWPMTSVMLVDARMRSSVSSVM